MRFLIIFLSIIFILVCGVASYLIFGTGANDFNMVATDDQLVTEEFSVEESMNSRDILFAMFAGNDATYTDQEFGTELTMNVENDVRRFTANGLPDHETGELADAIQAQNYELQVPVEPVESDERSLVGENPFGIALNGVIFRPSSGQFWNDDPTSGWQYEALGAGATQPIDNNNATVDENGSYHYHGVPTVIVADHESNQHSALIGYAADGFPIYARFGYRNPENSETEIVDLASSYKIKNGNREGGPGGPFDGTYAEDYEFVEGAGDLDECNGRFGMVPGRSEPTYAYFITNDFPYVPRCLVGIADQSFLWDGSKPIIITESEKDDISESSATTSSSE